MLVRSSAFLGDPPPDPRFLASLGALSWVELHHCCVVGLFIVFGQLGPSYASMSLYHTLRGPWDVAKADQTRTFVTSQRTRRKAKPRYTKGWLLAGP
jgi:hypothetical protein